MGRQHIHKFDSKVQSRLLSCTIAHPCFFSICLRTRVHLLNGIECIEYSIAANHERNLAVKSLWKPMYACRRLSAKERVTRHNAWVYERCTWTEPMDIRFTCTVRSISIYSTCKWNHQHHQPIPLYTTIMYSQVCIYTHILSPFLIHWRVLAPSHNSIKSLCPPLWGKQPCKYHRFISIINVPPYMGPQERWSYHSSRVWADRQAIYIVEKIWIHVLEKIWTHTSFNTIYIEYLRIYYIMIYM